MIPVVILLVAAAVLVFVAAPLLRVDAAQAEEQSRRIGEASELQSRHDMLLAALKDLEDDRATGKLDDADYESLKTRLTAEAVEVLFHRLDVVERKRLIERPHLAAHRRGQRRRLAAGAHVQGRRRRRDLTQRNVEKRPS